MNQKITFAGITAFNTIRFQLNAALKSLTADKIKVMEESQYLTILQVELSSNKDGGVITLSRDLDLRKTYTLHIQGCGTVVAVPTTVFDSKAFLANYTYDGSDLGAVMQSDGSTTFKVWAPTASAVVLNLFTAGDGVPAYTKLPMTYAEKGVWVSNVANTGHGTYYTYTVTTSAGTQEAVDPYARAIGVNGGRGMVVDLTSTNPAGWEMDRVISLNRYTDAVLWEIHVRDFSNTIATSKFPGKYLAFTERGLTNSCGVPVGVDHLLDLGVTHIHLLPSCDYASVDERKPTFNWGYDPDNYNVPEGSYSTDPYHGEVRIHEFKRMVQSVHEAGLGVVLDVVYNHTYHVNSNFNKIVPNYYYRLNPDGTHTNACGCGNDTASERYMFRKFMVESVAYWTREYHLDGLRFDLMGLHDLQTMTQIEAAVHAINPNVILYGEGWDMGATMDGSLRATQGNIGKILPSNGAAGSVAVFNDVIRDGLKGSTFGYTAKGYISGAYKENESAVRFGIQGGMGGSGWQVDGAAVINYMSAHDNNTLFDKLHLSNADQTEEELLAMNRLGAAIMMISKGTPFWQAGEEMLRSKRNADGSFNDNSYNASDAVNNLDWEALTTGSAQLEMLRYYQGLVQMRRAYDIFRCNSDAVTIHFSSLPGGGMAANFRDSISGVQALALINPTASADAYTLSGKWNLVADATRAGAAVLATKTGKVTVAPCSILVFVR